jgi:quinolinate synthase
VFCGVHFMAESADVLTSPEQRVILPDLAAGCSMADMAAIDQLEVCWEELRTLGLTSVIPVTYINSTAAIKGFCGEHGGLVCTSSNAAKVMAWAWERGEKLLMLPDQHLGRNTAFRMGVPLAEMVVWDPDLPFGGVDRAELERARLILWKGHCSVHTRFSVRQIEQFRQANPGGKVIVHPECTFDVVRAADDCGSTEHIIRTVKNSPEGSVWAVGTEIHLVNRLAREVAPARTVRTLDTMGCLCSTMFRVSPNHLLWVLDGLVDGEVHNRIVVPEPTKTWARVALHRMLELT